MIYIFYQKRKKMQLVRPLLDLNRERYQAEIDALLAKLTELKDAPSGPLSLPLITLLSDDFSAFARVYPVMLRAMVSNINKSNKLTLFFIDRY